MLTPNPGIRGPLPKIARALVPALQQHGVTVEQAAWGRHAERESLFKRMLGRALDLWRICRALNCGRFDGCFLYCTTHDQRALMRDLPLVGASLLLRSPVLCMFHGSECARLLSKGDQVFKLLTRLLVSGCDAFLVLSSEELDQWRQFSPAKRWHLVCNPFVPELGVGTPSQTHREACRSSKPVFLFVGRLIEEKGVLDLVNAFCLVRKEMDCELIVLGGGPLADRVRGCVAEFGVTSSVRLGGYLEGDALARAYSSATVFCLPTYFGEGFPTVIAEAMAAGLPVVTTKIRGAADHLVEGVNALFVPPRDPNALALAMLRLAQNPSLRGLMGAANIAKVREFAPSVVVQEYLAAIKGAFG
jgi:glycosyltransferase involved in cell wall biosynthesis